MIIVLVAVGICSANVIHQSRHTLSSGKDVTMMVKINPDDLTVDNNYVHGEGTLVRNHQKVLIHGVIQSKYQLHQIKANRYVSLWRFKGDVNKIDSPTNVNQFNAKRYYQSVGITNSIKIDQLLTLKNLHGFSISNWIHVFRHDLLIKAQRLPSSLKVYTLSLILGDTGQENDPELSGIKQLGLIHLFSISGFHVYYLVGLLELILVYLRVKRERYRIIILLFLPVYYVFAGASIGLLRSVLMVEIGLASRLFHRCRTSLNVWSLALILNLINSPQSLVQFGCQLSYVLSFVLIYTRKFTFWKQTIFMNLTSFPFIIFNIYSWHVLTIAANLLILPLFSSIIFPIVIGGSLLDHFSSGIGNLASLIIGWFDRGLNGISGLPGNIYFGKPSGILIIVTFLITLYLIGRSSRKWFVILFSLYLLMFMMIHFPLHGEISYFDVGQGDSFLIREPFNRSVTIIDTGGKLNFGHNTPPNYQALKTSINYLNSQGIYTIDNICISHQDADHCGDLPAFLQRMRVKRVFIPWGMNKNSHFMSRIKPYLGKTQLIQIKNDNVIPGTKLIAVHPFSQGTGTNSDSMVLSGKLGGKSWLFMGDLDQTGENSIINHYPNLRADVLKLGHHGSSTASGSKFLHQINPKIAIISAGRHNRYHHPDPDVVKRVLKQHIKIYNTQNSGMITYRYRHNTGQWTTNN